MPAGPPPKICKSIFCIFITYNPVFENTLISGTDFTDAVLDLPQVKGLCERATGKTAESLQCGGLNESYVPASKEQNKFNPGIS